MRGGVRDPNKGISSYWKTIFKTQHFSCICFGGFFSFKGRFLGMSYWGWVLNVLCLVFFLYVYLFICIHFQTRDLGQYPILLWLLTKGTVWLPTAQKPVNRPDWWKGKFVLFQMPATAGECRHLFRGWLPPPYSPQPPTTGIQWGKIFYRQKEAETAQSALPAIFKLVIGGLTSIILVVLGTVNLQFQGPFVPIPLRPVLGIMVAHVVGTVWLSCS